MLPLHPDAAAAAVGAGLGHNCPGQGEPGSVGGLGRKAAAGGHTKESCPSAYVSYYLQGVQNAACFIPYVSLKCCVSCAHVDRRRPASCQTCWLNDMWVLGEILIAMFGFNIF
ncbi:hypothetical protein ABBQ38_011115 [Trebouxia sp. C0009 RCD-2024]